VNRYNLVPTFNRLACHLLEKNSMVINVSYQDGVERVARVSCIISIIYDDAIVVMPLCITKYLNGIYNVVS